METRPITRRRTHPGEILRHDCLAPLGINVTAFAQKIGVTRKAASELLNGKAGVSASMALRLGKALGTTPEFWLNLQRNLDLWEASQKLDLNQVEVLPDPPTS